MEEKGKEGNGKETPDHLCLRHLNLAVATVFVFNKYRALLTVHIAFGTKSDFRENDSQRHKSNPFGLKSFFSWQHCSYESSEPAVYTQL